MKKSKTIFITRKLAEDSIFHKISADAHHLIDESLVQFETITNQELAVADLYFFYSRNGVEHILKSLNGSDSILNKPCAAIGPGTAKAMQDNGYKNIVYIGNSIATDIVRDLDHHFTNANIGVIRAKNSRRSIQKVLNRESIDIVAYNNQKKSCSISAPIDILIATSSMNAESFFDAYTGSISHAIAIGEPTANALAKLGVKNVSIASTATENGLYEKLLELLA